VPVILGFVIGAQCWSPCGAALSGSRVPPDDPRLTYCGAWECDSEDVSTVYGGSQLKLYLSGKARLLFRPGTGRSLMLSVREGKSVIWRGIPPESGLELNSGTTTSCFSVIYVAANRIPAVASSTNCRADEWRISGLLVESGSILVPSPMPLKRLMVEFLGDSITSGDGLCGRSGNPLVDADASLTYAFLLAERLGCSYRIRGYPGASPRIVTDKLVWLDKGRTIKEDLKPDMVFINLGANRRVDSDVQYLSDMKGLVEGIRDQYAGVKIVLMNFFRMTPDRMPVLASLAKKYPGEVSVFDARPYLVGYSDSGVHPDKESHRRLAAALEEIVIKRPDRPNTSAPASGQKGRQP